jgi:hypothetical protein
VAYVPHIANGLLFSITAPTNKAVWAIGRTYPKTGSGYSFLLHWNGTRWRKSGMPVSGFQPSRIASSSPSNVWMFGLSRSKSPLVLRWNGSRWLRLPGSGLIPFSLDNEAVLSPANVWIASQAGNGVAHWNGSSWTPIPLPSGLGNIQALGASSRSNVWLMGITGSGRLAAYRWRNGAWAAVRMPHPLVTFASMAVQSATSVWIREIYQAGSPVLFHWRGTAWYRRSQNAGWTNLPLQPYHRSGVWIGAGIWTGRSWISVSYPPGTVGQVNQIALAPVPRTTSAWFAVATLQGPTIWRK